MIIIIGIIGVIVLATLISGIDFVLGAFIWIIKALTVISFVLGVPILLLFLLLHVFC